MRNLTLWNDNLYNPWRTLMELQRKLDRVFDQTFATRADEWNEDMVFHPACDIEETDSHYVMSVDLPGVSKKDIHIEARDNQLIISGERKSERDTKAFSERYHGKFHRVVTLPAGVDTDKIEAQYQDGVLTLALPKVESAKPRQIKITDGKGSFFGKFIGGNKEKNSEDRPSAAASAA